MSANRPKPALSRGEVWEVDFGTPAGAVVGDPLGSEQGGMRPAVILSDDRLNASALPLVTVVPCTTSVRGLPTRARLDPPEGGLSAPSEAVGEQIRTVAVQRLVRRRGQLTRQDMAAVEMAVRRTLALP